MPTAAPAKPTKSTRQQREQAVFEVGDFKQPGTDTVHTNFRVTWTRASIRYRMQWRGDKVTMGVFGPERDTYVNFAKSIAKAPVLVPGYDRPFEFEHWMSGTFTRGRKNDFKVFVGNRGSGTGAFSCVDDDFFDRFEYVLATLIYSDTNGKQKSYRTKLEERC